MKDKIFGVLQRVGRSFMLPIALLPVAGLLLGVGSSFTNVTTLKAYGLEGIIKEGGALYGVLDIMKNTGSIVFDNLALLFAMGVAIGMAKKEKEVAALSGAIAYLIMNSAVGTLISLHGGENAMAANSTGSVLGITTLQMGVFGGIIVGLGVAALHNKFYKIKLPQVLSFFGGTRFVPIISSVVYLIVGVIMFYVWPVIQGWIASLGSLVLRSGYIGTWLYGTVERALIPFGLHHVFYMPFWQTELGGSAIVDNAVVQGAQNIFFAELASNGTKHFSVAATRFMAGKFPFMIFGLPAAAFAMYKAARPEKKKVVGGLLLSAGLTSMITGITEPLEFTFLFAAPTMYAVHCVLAGLSFMLMHICGVGVGMTFSGGLIDLTLFGILQGNAKTSWLWVIAVGAVYAVLYFVVFYFMITALRLKTPGREEGDEETKLYTRKDMNKGKKKTAHDTRSALILKGLGGRNNLSDIDCCATRLRITVKDASAVTDEYLKQSGASGIIKKGNGVQIVYGPGVSVIKSSFDDFLESEAAQNPDAVLGEFSLPIKEESTPEAFLGKTQIFSPLKGEILPLEKVDDDVFSQKILGEGVAVLPAEGKLYSPCDGTLTTVFDTGHAVNLVSEEGCEILLHIGIDTVKLGGKYFTAHKKSGDSVKKGDLLITFDLGTIKKSGYCAVTPIVICNGEDFTAEATKKNGKVCVGEKIIDAKGRG